MNVVSASPGLIKMNKDIAMKLWKTSVVRGAHPLADLDRVDGVIGGNLLDRLAATDRLYGDPGLEVQAVGAALAHWWELLSGAVPRHRG